MSVRKKQSIVIAFLIVGVALGLLSGQRGIGIAVVLAGGLLEAVLFRCPHCGRHLGRSFRPGKY